MNANPQSSNSPAEILIAEDSPTQARHLQFILDRAGYRVTTAADGRKALEVAWRQRPDLIVSDVLMPEMDGYQLCRELKADEGLCAVPVMLLTSLVDAAEIMTGLECGANAFLTKPFKEEYLLTLIASLLVNHRPGHTPDDAQSAIEVTFAGRTLSIDSDRRQILDLLLSTNEIAVQRSIEFGRAQVELQTLNQRLEDKVKERTAALTAEIEWRKRVEEDLRKSKDAAEAATRAKTEFLANMSHELRTPLNAVIGFSEGLLERTNLHPLNEHQKDRIGRIAASGQYLLQLINGVLDIAKVESGKSELQIKLFDVGPVVKEVVDMGESLVRDKPEICLSLDLEENLQPIISDRDKLRQILVNLLGNAIVYTERGSVTLRVRRNNGSLLFMVEDTGIGISAENLDRVFEKFYQIKQDPQRPQKGTGLGLPIAEAFAQLLGGKLTVESVEGQGSTFTLSLPLILDRRGGEERRKPVQSEPAPIEWASEGAEPPHVLCIEADEANLALLDDYLTKAGYQVVQAASGTEGYLLAATKQPKAIILNVMLPSGDGWGTLYRLKADPATSHIPVIVATDLDEQRLGLFLGADEYLVKPIDKAKLLAVLDRLALDPLKVHRVSIVDDDPDVLWLFKCILEKENYEVRTYESGEEFLGSLETQRPDLAIVDLLMPHMDGFEVIDKLREHPVCWDVPVIVLTAKVLTEDDLLRLNRSACAVIRKDGTGCEAASQQLVNKLHLMEMRK